MNRPIGLAMDEPDRGAHDYEPEESDRSRVLSLLGPVPTGIDDLVRLSGASPATVRIVLLELELAGRLEHHGGTLVSLTS